MDGGGYDPICAQQVHGIAYARDICHRIQRADLVKMHIPHRASVRLRLCLRDGIIDGTGRPLDLFREIHPADKIGDVARRSVMMVVAVLMLVMVFVFMAVFMIVPVLMLMAMVVSIVLMFMAVFVIVMLMGMLMIVVMIVFVVMMMVLLRCVRFHFLLAVYGNAHMRPGDAAGTARGGFQMDAGQAQTVHFVQKRLLVVQKLVQGRKEHIARRPHIAFQIKRFHCCSFSNPSI